MKSMTSCCFAVAGVLLAQPAAGSADGPAAPIRVIGADFDGVCGPHSKVFKECIGAGRANEGLRADWLQQLALVQKEIGFRSIRMHGLLHDDTGVYGRTQRGRQGQSDLQLAVRRQESRRSTLRRAPPRLWLNLPQAVLQVDRTPCKLVQCV
jgi:hypothetical protein